MQLTAEMRQAVEQEQLGIVATVRPDGTPALSPKGTTTVWSDSQLVFLHIHSEGTVANLTVNPAIEINVVDPIARRGWRFRGRATVHNRRAGLRGGHQALHRPRPCVRRGCQSRRDHGRRGGRAAALAGL